MIENNVSSVTEDTISARYQRAEALMQLAYGAKKAALNIDIAPHWIGGSHDFWYRQETPTGACFVLVDAEKQHSDKAFNHVELAQSLARESGQAVDAENLPLHQIDIVHSPRAVYFSAFGERWKYQESSGRCTKDDGHSKEWKVSPDGKYAVFVRDHNLWLYDFEVGQERALTQDGQEFYRYGSGPSYTGLLEVRPIIDIVWSPDSRQLATPIIDTREVSKGIPLVQHVPEDGSLCPTLLCPERRVTFYKDAQVEAWQLVTIDIETKELQWIDHPPIPMNYPCYQGYFQAGRGWWCDQGRYLYYVHQENDRTKTQLFQWDSHANQAQLVFAESPEMKAHLLPKTHERLLATPLVETNELIWYSERSGWAHLYLYDLTTGVLKNAITSGPWLVRSILHIDKQQRELWIQTAGRVEGRNPYYQDICRVNIDTGELTPVVSSDHEYIIYDQKSGTSLCEDKSSLSVSPDGQYVVATRTRVDQLPESILFNREGKELLHLQTTELAGMPKHWHWPETVKTVATDGVSEISGLVYRPSDFSPDKSYPILDYSFLTYVEPLAAFGWLNLEAMAFAELGFIVVKFFNRDIPGLRSVAFREGQDLTRPYPGMADNLAGIQQLAATRPYMDHERIGASIHSSLPTALALLIYPDFYKVGVSINAVTDARLLGELGEKFGGDEFPPYEEFAKNLRGKLLLIAGMLDPVTPVTGTFRLTEALQKANKPFDQLLLPNFGHEFSGYVTKRTWDYLVEHLQGVKPPEDYELLLQWTD